TGGDPPAAGSDRGGSRGLRSGLAILEARGELRRDALIPADRHARASLALLARCAALGDGVHQRLPRRAPPRADRPAPRSLAGMARRLRARAVPVPAGDPARLPHGRGPGHQGLPASPPRPDQDEAPDRLVVDPAAARLRGPAAQAMIRIAVIGAGQWGPNLIRNFHNRRTSEVAWVVDRDAGRLAQVRERFPDIRVDTDAETVMADGRIDAVVIATPTSTHHALAKRALGVGKHVLVEKPITADSAEAEELCSLAAQAGRILMAGDVLVNLHISWLSPRKTREITLVGDRRMLTFDDMNLSEPVRVYDKRVTEVRTSAPYIDSFASFRASLREGDITIPKIALGEPLKAECDHFLECIAGGKCPLTAGPEALTVVRALEAIQRSIRGAGH